MKKHFAIQCFESSLDTGLIGNTYQYASFRKDFTLLFQTEADAEVEVAAIMNGERPHRYKALSVIPVYFSND